MLLGSPQIANGETDGIPAVNPGMGEKEAARSVDAIQDPLVQGIELSFVIHGAGMSAHTDHAKGSWGEQLEI